MIMFADIGCSTMSVRGDDYVLSDETGDVLKRHIRVKECCSILDGEHFVEAWEWFSYPCSNTSFWLCKSEE